MRPSEIGPGLDFESIEETDAALAVFKGAIRLARGNSGRTFLGWKVQTLYIGAGMMTAAIPETFEPGSTSIIGIEEVEAFYRLGNAVAAFLPDQSEAIHPLLDEIARVRPDLAQ